MATLTEVDNVKCFGGHQKIITHESSEVKCKMNFAVYLPPHAEQGKVPVLYWLSGLTCTEKNFIEKAGAQKYAAEHRVAIVCPDTSPRGCDIEGEEDSYAFGTGAGFYVDATENKWKDHYRMFSYVNGELQSLVNDNFPVLPDKSSIFGHSMGGHGALISALKNPGKYRSVSALAPICNPTNSDWGKMCFAGYLGLDNTDQWKEYDATCLVQNYQGPPMEILIDQGKDDEYYKDGNLKPEVFVKACAENQMPVIFRLQEGYGHSYYFVSTFVEDHIKHHVKYLNL